MDISWHKLDAESIVSVGLENDPDLSISRQLALQI
ncbi:MAG: hypothetical protein ACI8UX_001294 [Psychromonas sp.]|jgi:hypothetical protein